MAKCIALALGGGGARGYAHIGVIHEIRARGHEIVGISGTSMGALVGGLTAAGVLEGYVDWVSSLSARDVLLLLDPSLKVPGAIRLQKVMSRVSGLLDGARIEDLHMPFTAVATDLAARKEVWFQHGPVDAAIRASIAIPSVISPVTVNGRLLADGGLLNPVPIAPLNPLHVDAIVAVSLAGRTRGEESASVIRASTDERTTEGGFERIRRAAAHVLDRDLFRRVSGGDRASSVEEDGAPHYPSGLRTLDVLEMSLDAMQTLITRYRLAGYPPDVLIEVPMEACGTLEFHRAPEMIALGRALAGPALDVLDQDR